MMSINEHIKYWIESADNDLDAAESLFVIGKYDWCLFIGHLVLEKGLKAYYVYINNNNNPPRLHNLLKLSQLSGLKLNEDRIEFFDLVNNFHLEGRYPEYKNEFYKKVDKDFAAKNFGLIKENYLWLKSLIKY